MTSQPFNHSNVFHQGAAFGFSMIAATAREELSSHLPLLVPRLYRYKYDPNPRVQLAMTSIWSAVVPESKKAVSGVDLAPRVHVALKQLVASLEIPNY